MPRRRPPAGPRTPTHEELLVWDYVTRDDARLPHAEIDWKAVEAELAASPEPAGNRQAQPSDDQLDSLLHKTAFSAAGAAHAQPAAKGAGIDRNSARRLRQGKLPIEATLDLHGMTREEAQGRLIAFLGRAYEAGMRCVLVVTGKGKFRTEGEGGVLRRELPRWLARPPVAPWVLRHETARQQHGGEGAVYILLRRRR